MMLVITGTAAANGPVHLLGGGVCTATLTSSLFPTGGDYSPGDVIHYVITLSIPASPDACSLDNVDVFFFPPRHKNLDPCDFPPDAVKIASSLSLGPGDSFSWNGSDNPVLDYSFPPSDAGFVVFAGAAFSFHVASSDPPLEDCDEKTVEDFVAAQGACCLPGGTTCVVLTAKQCADQGGVYQGHDVPCDPSPCVGPPSQGACCVEAGACVVLTAEECAAQGGIYQGDDVTCVPNPCPTGACCLGPVGPCEILTMAACDAAGGTYLGDGMDCGPGLCPPTATEPITWGRLKHKLHQ